MCQFTIVTPISTELVQHYCERNSKTIHWYLLMSMVTSWELFTDLLPSIPCRYCENPFRVGRSRLNWEKLWVPPLSYPIISADTGSLIPPWTALFIRHCFCHQLVQSRLIFWAGQFWLPPTWQLRQSHPASSLSSSPWCWGVQYWSVVPAVSGARHGTQAWSIANNTTFPTPFCALAAASKGKTRWRSRATARCVYTLV